MELYLNPYPERGRRTYNTRLRFYQTYPAHIEYVNYLSSIFSSFIGPKGSPRIHTRKPDSRTGKIYSTIAFKTRSLPCFTMFHNLFYLNCVKIVTANMTCLFTPVALAPPPPPLPHPTNVRRARGGGFWIMDDGSISHHGQTILHTNACTPAEIALLKLRTRVIQKIPGQQLLAIPPPHPTLPLSYPPQLPIPPPHHPPILPPPS